MKKRILVLCPHPVNVAPGQRLKYEQYFDAWEKEGYEIEVSPFMTNRFWDIVYKPGNVLEKVVWTLFGYLRRIKDLFRLKNYDIVYVFLWGTPFGTPLYERWVRKLSKHLIFDIDDMVFLGHSSNANRLFEPLKGKNKMIYLMKKADHVITCTPLLDQFTRKFNINTSDISSTVDTEERYQVVNQYTNDSKVVLGWSGSHSTSKYLYLLKDVLVDLAKEFDFKLLVMGDASFNIKGVNVEAHAWSEEIEMPTLKKFDIGLYPLPNEKWVYGKSGLKAIQYMALGVPTIATAIGANFRIIENDKNGYLVDSGNYTLWKEYLGKLISDAVLRKRLGTEARKTIEDKYSVSANSKRYLDVFKSVERIKPYKGDITFQALGKKKITLFTVSMDGGGAERVMANLANSLSEKYNVDLILLTSNLKQDINENVSITLLNASNKSLGSVRKLLNIPFAAYKLSKYLKNEKPDVVVSFLNRPNIIAVLSKYIAHHQKIIISERTFPSRAFSSSKWTDRLTRLLIRSLYNKADSVFVNSKGTYIDLMERYNVDQTKLSVLNNPIDFVAINNKKNEEIPFTYKRDGFRFLMLGRIDTNKNQIGAAVAFLKANIPDSYLYIFGEGTQKVDLEKYVAKHDFEKRIIIGSYQDNPYKWIEYCDCVVLNSTFEGFPNVLLESIYLSTPVVSADCESGPREVIARDTNEFKFKDNTHVSDRGVLFPVGSEEGLIAGLVYVAKNANNFNGDSNRIVEFEEKFSMESVVKNLESILF
ncbi:MAG: glycosyltransferase [Salibacteraceae bacterium]